MKINRANCTRAPYFCHRLQRAPGCTLCLSEKTRVHPGARWSLFILLIRTTLLVLVCWWRPPVRSHALDYMKVLRRSRAGVR